MGKQDSNGGIPPFPGRIGRTLADSEPHFQERPHPGADSPNVMLVLLDDVGFAQFGCFGSDIETPNIDALAKGGLQFTNFHVTPLCSPTRASLLTGRSQHAVGMRSVSNFRTGFPHQLGHISNNAGTIAEVLKAKGYITFCAGKWHLAPTQENSAAGPFDQWPLARGFDRFYGFLEGETDQFHPELVIDNHHANPPRSAEEGYHLSEDLVDNLLKMINDSRHIRPDRPFFAYLPFGATHAPHQAPASYLHKYRGRYDEGWDVHRQRWYEKQLANGVVPPGTKLAPRNAGVKPWNELTENEQKLACRLQEAFAAFLDHTDDQIGRVVNALRNAGELDNTIFIVLADNGASQEGGPLGTLHEMKYFNGLPEAPDEAINRLDTIGGPFSHTNYPWGWAQCGNSPFKWYKQNTHEGGVHVPMVMHWPAGLGEAVRGSKRHQFINVADIVPTIYELLGVTPPSTLKGYVQMPVTGHSFASVLADENAPATNRLQYFEMAGSRALVAEIDGRWWKAVTRHIKGKDYEDDKWELYDLDVDPSECNDLAEAEPSQLRALIDLWWQEAENHGVLPLDDRTLELFRPQLSDRSPHRKDRRYRYRPPMSPIPMAAAPSPGGMAWDLAAVITFAKGDEGALYASGNGNSGVALFVQNNRLVADYNAFGEHLVVESPDDLPEGQVSVSLHLRRVRAFQGRLTMAVGGEVCAEVDLPIMMMMASSTGASVGEDHGLAVSTRYRAPYPYTGTLHLVEIEAGNTTEAEISARAVAEMARQ